jgi:hypothetical protein
MKREVLYMFMFHLQNTGEVCNSGIPYKSINNVAVFSCLGITMTNGHNIHDEIKSRLSFYYHSFVESFFLLIPLQD